MLTEDESPSRDKGGLYPGDAQKNEGQAVCESLPFEILGIRSQTETRGPRIRTDTNNLPLCNISYRVEKLVRHDFFGRIDRRRVRFVPGGLESSDHAPAQ